MQLRLPLVPTNVVDAGSGDTAKTVTKNRLVIAPAIISISLSACHLCVRIRTPAIVAQAFTNPTMKLLDTE